MRQYRLAVSFRTRSYPTTPQGCGFSSNLAHSSAIWKYLMMSTKSVVGKRTKYVRKRRQDRVLASNVQEKKCRFRREKKKKRERKDGNDLLAIPSGLLIWSAIFKHANVQRSRRISLKIQRDFHHQTLRLALPNEAGDTESDSALRSVTWAQAGLIAM